LQNTTVACNYSFGSGYDKDKMRTVLSMQLQEYKVAKIFCKRLPISTVATAFKAMCKYCGTVSNPFKPDKTLLKVIQYPLFLDTSNSTALFEGSQAAPACPSDKF
jgi:hypothetical protein